MRGAMTALALLACLNTRAQDGHDKLYATVGKYIDAKSTPAAEKEWQRKFNAKIDQRCADNEALNLESAAQAIALEWATGKQAEIREFRTASAETVLEACRMLKWFTDNKVSLPSKIAEHFTDETARIVAEYVEGKIAEK